MQNRNFTLTSDNLENLETFSEVLKKDYSTMMNEALEDYFKNEQKRLMDKSAGDENSMTNLDFNEFWDDLEV